MSYTIAQNLDEAVSLLQGGAARLIAGGTDYFPAKVRGAAMPDLVDISRAADLRGIVESAKGWRIGGATTWRMLVDAPLPPAFDGLKAAARAVGGAQVQNAGTLAGNLCNASPAADGVPPLLTLDAAIELASCRGRRVVPLHIFITGARQTACQPDEVVSAVLIPRLPPNVRGHFSKLGNRKYLVISMTMVAAAIGLDTSGRIDYVRMVVGACSPVAQSQDAIAARIIGQRPEVVRIAPEDLQNLSPITDIRGDPTFRLAAAATQLARLITAAGRR